MKKKILVIIIIVILGLGLLLLTGCGNKNEENANNTKNSSDEKVEDVYITIGNNQYKLGNKTKLNGLHYLENYVDFNTDSIGNTKSMSFNYEGSFSFEVRINCEEEHSIDEVKSLVLGEYQEQTKTVNGITYSYYEYKSNLNDDVHYYLHEHNNKVYSIAFFLGETHGDIEEVFMNNVKFE